MDDTLRTKIEKIKALAERGVGGEKETAQRKLDKILKENGLTLDDLSDETTHYYLFSYNGAHKKRLLSQIIYKVVGTDMQLWHTKGTRNKIGTYCTPSQKIEIDLDFEFYSNILDEELDIFVSAFISKQSIYPEDAPVTQLDRSELTPEELDRLNKRSAYAKGITHRTRNLMIEDNNE